MLDEPFNAVDARTVTDLVALIKRWHGEKRTVMVVAHDLDLVRQHFPQTLLLARRPIAWGPTAEALKPENLLRARRFDEAWHDDAPWCEPEPHEHGGDDHAHLHAHGHHHHHEHGEAHDSHDHETGPRAA